jgi:hypothetical protein
MNFHLFLRIALILALPLVATNCQRKEKVLDVKTPDGGISVERDKKTGEVSIETKSNR